MEITDLQKYIIKRQFIKNIQLLRPQQNLTDSVVFKSNNNVEFELSIQPFDKHHLLQTQLKIYAELLKNFNDAFENNVTILGQHVMQDVPTEQIISGIIPKFKKIKLTIKFLQWEFPAIHEIVDAYLNDTAVFWKENQNFNVMLMFENRLFN